VAVGVAGLGAGLTFAAMPTLIVRSVSADVTGSETGFYQIVRSVGLWTGSALATALLASQTSPNSPWPAESGFIEALTGGRRTLSRRRCRSLVDDAQRLHASRFGAFALAPA
jgi:hypothetical protein